MDARRAAGRLLAPVRPLLQRGTPMVPGYLVVGTKRGGSTSIAHWINQHPEVAPCRTQKGTHYFDVNHARGWEWYLSGFERMSPRWRITGEASPYYMFHPLAAERIAAALPDVRIVVSLREPVARAWSHHQYETQRGFETETFERALELEPERLRGEEDRLRSEPAYESHAHRHHTYLTRGHYAEQIERLQSLLSPEQVLVLRSESLFEDPHGQLNRVWDHLRINRTRVEGLDRYKATNRPLAVQPATVERLAEHYRPWNERLYALPGVDCRWDPVV